MGIFIQQTIKHLVLPLGLLFPIMSFRVSEDITKSYKKNQYAQSSGHLMYFKESS